MVEIGSPAVAEYSFVTEWRFAAPREAVFDVLHDSERWPEWWRGLESVEKLEGGDEEGRGSLGRYTWRSLARYRVSFAMRITEVERPRALAGCAEGDLSGTGRFVLKADDGKTDVVFEWRVSTRRAWMNLLAPLARPVFRWNHDWIMRQGGRGLAERLGVPLLSGA